MAGLLARIIFKTLQEHHVFSGCFQKGFSLRKQFCFQLICTQIYDL